MAMLSEEVVEEWLNRRGFFTIRGIKVGLNEIDLLAIKKTDTGVDAWHVEVQVSINPVAFISKTRRADRAFGIGANSARARTREVLAECVEEFVNKKFNGDDIKKVRNKLWSGDWKYFMALGNVKDDREPVLIKAAGVGVFFIKDIIKALGENKNNDFVITKATGGDLVDLVLIKDKLEDTSELCLNK